MCYINRDYGHFLYVCDTRNHAIREINLLKKEVLTVIGTGEYDKIALDSKLTNFNMDLTITSHSLDHGCLVP